MGCDRPQTDGSVSRSDRSSEVLISVLKDSDVDML